MYFQLKNIGTIKIGSILNLAHVPRSVLLRLSACRTSNCKDCARVFVYTWDNKMADNNGGRRKIKHVNQILFCVFYKSIRI